MCITRPALHSLALSGHAHLEAVGSAQGCVEGS